MSTPALRQTWTVSAVLINMFVQGMLISYPSSLMPALRDPNSSITADLNTASWLSAAPGMSMFVGFFMSSLLMDALGRRISHLICILPGFIGWLLIYFAAGIPQIMLGRILGGATAGSSVSLGAIVIGEYTSPKLRGMFLNLKTASVCIGGLVVHILTHYLSWRNIALVALAPNVIAILINFTWHESPAWLACQKQYDKSEYIFYWLRGRSKASRDEIKEMIKAQKDRFAELQPKSTRRQKISEFFRKFTKRDFVKPLNIIAITTILLESSGRHTFPAYATQIIGEITKEKSESFYYTLGLDITITVSAVLSSLLVKVINKRTLLFTTGFSAVAVLGILCLYLYLVSLKLISSSYSWIPVFLLVVYFILSNLGCTPIPLALLGELFPLAHRGAGSGLSGVIVSLCFMSVLQITPLMLVTFKVHGTFAIYGAIMVLTLITLYFKLPETKDKTLQEIENYFNYGEYKKETCGDEEQSLKILETKE